MPLDHVANLYYFTDIIRQPRILCSVELRPTTYVDAMAGARDTVWRRSFRSRGFNYGSRNSLNGLAGAGAAYYNIRMRIE